ncbi:nuclear transport factor 2 family protein [Lacihabitans sp. CCS-44]|nr:nuclear transport factor 2 family protein [Lacihabitans sp. CCS-44]
MKSSNNQKIIDQYFEHFNKHEWSKMANMYSNTAEFKDPSLDQSIARQTRQQIVTKYSKLHQVFVDIHDEIIQSYSTDDGRFIVEFLSTGTVPDGSKFGLPICTIFTTDNRLITNGFIYYDNFKEAVNEK